MGHYDFDTSIPDTDSDIDSSDTIDDVKFLSEHICQKNEFEVEIQVGNEKFSGTDNLVEIMIYFFDGNRNVIPVTRWQKLNTLLVDDFERWSRRSYCVPFSLNWNRFEWGSSRKAIAQSISIQKRQKDFLNGTL